MNVKEKLTELIENAENQRLSVALCCTVDELIDIPRREEYVAEYLIAHGATVQEWISVEDGLPKDGEIVLIYDGNAYQWKPEQSVAKFVKGKSKEQLKAEGYKTICSADEDGNNKKPYKWVSTNSPMSWFGQMVTHWMPLPQPPKGE